MNGVIVYKGESIPDRKLEKTITYFYYPSTGMKEDILKDVEQHLKCDLEDYVVELKIEVNLKKYDTKNT